MLIEKLSKLVIT